MSPNDLIDRYIAEIGSYLPRKIRLDLKAEILSTVEDMLTERSQKTGKPVDEEMTVEILKEYGAPWKVAASYQPERFLIGPRLYPSFLTVIQVVLSIMAAITLVRMGISLGQIGLTFDNVFEAVFLVITDFLGSAFTALGGIMVLFTIVQRFLPEFREKSGEWDPYQLQESTPRNRIEVGNTLVEIISAGLAIVLFNFFPQMAINIGYHANGSWWIGVISTGADSIWSTTILSHAFFDYLPALTILWILIILLDVALLSRSHWETWTRWSSFGLKVVVIAVAGFMLAGPSLVHISTEVLITGGFPDPLAAKLLANFAEQGTIVALVITIIANIVAAIRLLIRLTGRNLSPTLERFAHP